MIVYLLTNTETRKRYVGVQIKDEDVIRKHRTKKIIPELHKDIQEVIFEYKILSKPNELRIAEELEQFYIDFYNTKQRGYNTKDTRILKND